MWLDRWAVIRLYSLSIGMQSEWQIIRMTSVKSRYMTQISKVGHINLILSPREVVFRSNSRNQYLSRSTLQMYICRLLDIWCQNNEHPWKFHPHPSSYSANKQTDGRPSRKGKNSANEVIQINRTVILTADTAGTRDTEIWMDWWNIRIQIATLT